MLLQAAAAAAELAQLQQQLPVVPHSGRISSFGEYKRTAKRQQADLDEEAQLEQQEEEAAAAAAAGSKRRKLSQEQQQGKSDGSGSSRPGSAAVGDAKEAATKQLRDFVKVRTNCLLVLLAAQELLKLHQVLLAASRAVIQLTCGGGMG